MRACENGHENVLRFLLKKGAKIDRVTDGCSSALTIACHFGQLQCVKVLLGIFVLVIIYYSSRWVGESGL